MRSMMIVFVRGVTSQLWSPVCALSLDRESTTIPKTFTYTHKHSCTHIAIVRLSSNCVAATDYHILYIIHSEQNRDAMTIMIEVFLHWLLSAIRLVIDHSLRQCQRGHRVRYEELSLLEMQRGREADDGAKP